MNIVDASVKNLHEITAADVVGVRVYLILPEVSLEYGVDAEARASLSEIWDKIHGNGSWNRSPSVIVAKIRETFPASTHGVYRGHEFMPCYCDAKMDHQIGREVNAKAEALARRFHETYERLAPNFGYETRAETREFAPDTANGRLMIAVCAEILSGIGGKGGV